MSLQRLPPERAPDKSLTPKKSYSRKILAHTWQEWKKHFGMKASVTSVASVLLAWWKTGVFFDVAINATLTFVVVMAALYLLELLRSPYALGKALNEQVGLLQGEIAESKRVKVTFEVSTKTWESEVCLTDTGDTEDWRDATAFMLEAKLFIRYCNDDAEPIRIYDLKLSIRNDVTGKEYAFTPGHILRPIFREPDGTETRYFVGFMIPGKKLTDYYFHHFQFDVPPECALSADKDSYLRVTLEAGKQDPFWVDLDVPWRAARTGYPTVSIRPASTD